MSPCVAASCPFSHFRDGLLWTILVKSFYALSTASPISFLHTTESLEHDRMSFI